MGRCILCDKEVSNILKHKHEVHDSEMSDAAYVAMELGLPGIPKCPNCGSDCKLSSIKINFNKYCSNSCSISYRNKQMWKIPEYREMQCRRIGKLFGEANSRRWKDPEARKVISTAISERNRRKWKEPEYRKKMTKILTNNGGKTGFHSGPSKVEIQFHEVLCEIFPNLTIIPQYGVGKYHMDYYIKEFNIGLEVDGEFHNVDFDLNRDKFIYINKGILIRRFDYYYIRDWASKYELIWAILLELILKIPYYERIPYDELSLWKWTPTQIGPRRQLEWKR